VQVTVLERDAGQPFAATVRGPAFDAAHAAFRRAYGQPAVELGNGGTIPFVAAFADAFPAAELLVTSAGADPDTRAHGIDESLHLGDFERACLAETFLLGELATAG
jgi:acetylornithine deacetylase/succinyl-diaminopimelate desuccinylase-like protein